MPEPESGDCVVQSGTSLLISAGKRGEVFSEVGERSSAGFFPPYCANVFLCTLCFFCGGKDFQFCVLRQCYGVQCSVQCSVVVVNDAGVGRYFAIHVRRPSGHQSAVENVQFNVRGMYYCKQLWMLVYITVCIAHIHA